MILITGDLHLNDLARDEYRHDWIRDRLPPLLRKHRAEALVILGDLTDDKDHLSSVLVNSIVDSLYALAGICPVIILKGNHDYAEADNPFFRFLDKIPAITWVNEPTVIEGDLYLPHTYNYERDWKDIELEGRDIIFAHQTFQGAQVGPRKLEGIPTSIFPPNAQILSGDVHVPQSFGRVTYVGAPYLCDFGDRYSPRVLVLGPSAYKSIPSPGPQKRLMEVCYPNRKIERPWTDYFKCNNANPGDILKIRVTIEPSQAPDWPAIKQEIATWADENGYIPYLIQPQVDSSATKSMAKRKVSNKTDEQLVETYVKARAVSEATLRTGLNLLRKT